MITEGGGRVGKWAFPALTLAGIPDCDSINVSHLNKTLAETPLFELIWAEVYLQSPECHVVVGASPASLVTAESWWGVGTTVKGLLTHRQD